MKNRIAIILAFMAFLCSGNLHAQSRDEVTYSDTYLDTVTLKKVFFLNDYSMIGVEYGASGHLTMFNPTRKTEPFYKQGTFGVYYTKYSKLFGYMPYFGLKVGLRHGYEGYKFKADKETGAISTIEGATQAIMEFVDLPMTALMHFDSQHFTTQVEVGIYGGYRMNIERIGDNVSDELRNSFKDTDNRFDYGLTGGLGFGLVYDPFEFQVHANVRYSWGSLYAPDYYSQYYYRFAYPLDVMVTAGLYFHITKRTGKTKPQLKREAYDHVFHPKPVAETKDEDPFNIRQSR